MKIYALLVFLLACLPLADGDIWWHLASAKEMIQTRQPLFHDPFTFSTNNGPWINVHWLYQLLIYIIYKSGGYWGILFGHALLWASAAWVWVRAFRIQHVAWLWIFTPFLFSIRFLLLPRPLALTMLLLGLQWLTLTSKYSFPKKIILISLLQILLTNIQGLFLLGPALLTLASIYLAFSWKQSILFVGSSVLASIANPHGLSLLVYPWRLLQRLLPGNTFSSGVSENISPFKVLLNPHHFWQQQAVTIQALFLALFTLYIIYWVYRNAHFRQSFPIVILLILGWLAERNLPILYLIVIPLLVAQSTAWKFRISPYWIAFAFLAGTFASQVQWFSNWPYPIAPFRTPQGAIQFLENQKAPPNQIFCEIRHAGAVEWHLYPRTRTYTDGRLILRNSEFFQRYLDFTSQPEDFLHLMDSLHVGAILLPVAYPSGWHSLAQAVVKDSRWQLKHLDETSWLFFRSDSNLRSSTPFSKDSLFLDYQERSKPWPPFLKHEGRIWLTKASEIL